MNKVEDFINATKLNDLLNKKEDLINMTKLNELLNKKEAEEKTAAEEKEKQRIYRYNRRACGKPEWKYENRIGNSWKYNGKCKKGMK